MSSTAQVVLLVDVMMHDDIDAVITGSWSTASVPDTAPYSVYFGGPVHTVWSWNVGQ